MDTHRNAPHIPLGTEVEFFQYSGRDYEKTDELLLELCAAGNMTMHVLMKDEEREAITSLIAFGMAPEVKDIREMDASGRQIALGHKLGNDISPIIGYAHLFLGAKHPITQQLEHSIAQLQRLFPPVITDEIRAIMEACDQM